MMEKKYSAKNVGWCNKMKQYKLTYEKGKCIHCERYGKMTISEFDNKPRCSECFAAFLIRLVKGRLMKEDGINEKSAGDDN
jgi:hypothetical protein